MASAAPSGKKKGRKKAVAVDLNVFLQSEGSADGKAVTITKTGSSWSDPRDYGQGEEKTVVLPTAPSSVRGGMSVDVDRIPHNGPFKAFIANVSYDADEGMISDSFEGLDVLSIHLPCDDTGRFKGFGYVEFGSRDDLIEALQMDVEVAGRKLRIDLKTPSERDQQQSRGYSSFGRISERGRADDDTDWRAGPRTLTSSRTGSDWRSGPSGGGDSDWRSGPRSDFGGDRDRGGFGSFGGRDRDREPATTAKPGSKYEPVPSFAEYTRAGGGYGSDRRNDDRYGGRDDRYGDRGRGGSFGFDRRGDDRGYGGRDDRYYGDRDRGGGGYGYDRRGDDRGYGSRDDRYYGDRDRGGYDRRGDDRYGDRGRDDRYGSRYDSRDDRPSGDADRAPSERPKLNQKPRTLPVDEVGKVAATSSSIFGGAKPVDTTARDREVEERLRAARIDDRPRASEPASGSQRRAEASRDIRLTEPARTRDSDKSDNNVEARETNGKVSDGGEKRERAPRPAKTADDPAVLVEESRFSALAEDEDD